jgi:hypothetical protein
MGKNTVSKIVFEFLGKAIAKMPDNRFSEADMTQIVPRNHPQNAENDGLGVFLQAQSG